MHQVGVGMRITEHPLHRSGRAALPHPAPVSGTNGGRRRVESPAVPLDTDDRFALKESTSP
jgi:hypothetical protein